MKITAARVIVCCPGRNFVTLKIETDQGVYGIGDATLNGGTVVIGGILSSTLLTLLVLPGLYRLLARKPGAAVPP